MSNEHVLGFRPTFSATFLGLFFNDLPTFIAKNLMSRFAHFFPKIFVTEKQTLQTFSPLECMPAGSVDHQVFEV